MNLQTILEKSLTLLNERGYHNTDIDRLLENLQIRPSDFYRDIRDFDDLIVRIFYSLCNEADAASAEIDQSSRSLEILFSSINSSYHIQVKYHFLFTDLGRIIQRHERVKDRYFELISLRKAQLIQLFQRLNEEKIFKKENFTGSYENLANQMTMLSDYWPSHNQIIFGDETFHYQYYSKLVFSMVLPFLTDSGLELYKKILGYDKNPK